MYKREYFVMKKDINYPLMIRRQNETNATIMLPHPLRRIKTINTSECWLSSTKCFPRSCFRRSKVSYANRYTRNFDSIIILYYFILCHNVQDMWFWNMWQITLPTYSADELRCWLWFNFSLLKLIFWNNSPISVSISALILRCDWIHFPQTK